MHCTLPICARHSMMLLQDHDASTTNEAKQWCQPYVVWVTHWPEHNCIPDLEKSSTHLVLAPCLIPKRLLKGMWCGTWSNSIGPIKKPDCTSARVCSHTVSTMAGSIGIAFTPCNLSRLAVSWSSLIDIVASVNLAGHKPVVGADPTNAVSPVNSSTTPMSS